jgi:hypothetical protein
MTCGMAWAGVRIVRLRLAVLVPPIDARESVPVSVSGYVPGGALAVVIVNVEVKPPAVPLEGLKLAVAPAGSPDSDNPIVGSPVSGDPATSASVIAKVFEPVVKTCWLVGLPATVKS